MTKEADQIKQFLSEFVGAGKAKEEFDKTENKKRLILEEVAGSLKPEDKERIRAGMQFTLVDSEGKKQTKSFSEDGQEYAVDTFGALKKGHKLSEKDAPKVQAAMDQIVKLTRKAIDALIRLKNSDGTPVYDVVINEDDSEPTIKRKKKNQVDFSNLIEIEVFSPLVREGLIPENFVLDDFSEVQKLLNATFHSYKETTEEARKEQEERAAKREKDYHGGGGKIDMIKGLLGKADQLKEQVLGKIQNKIQNRFNFSDKTWENLGTAKELGTQGAKALGAFAKLGINIHGWVPDEGIVKNLRTEERFLDPKEHKDAILGNRQFVDGDPLKGEITSEDSLRVALDQSKREKLITFVVDGCNLKNKEHAEFIKKQVTWFCDNVLDSNEYFYSTSSVDLLGDLIGGVLESIETGGKIGDSKAVLEKVSKEFKAQKVAESSIDKFDQAVSSAIQATSKAKSTSIVFSSLFGDEVSLKDLIENTVPTANGAGVAAVFGKAIAKGFVAGATSPLEPNYSAFFKSGIACQTAFVNAAPTSAFEELMATDPEAAFKLYIDGVPKAIAAGLSEELKSILQDPEELKLILKKSIFPDEEKAMQEMEEAEKELKDYERQLVLIDDTGISMAQEKSLEKLIAELEKDQQTLQMVAQAGSMLSGVGGSVMGIANWPSDKLTDIVSGQVVGALNAAKMVMQLSVNIKKAVDRWAMMVRFKKDLARSKKAVSSLSSTIQGFLDNKVEQITFRTIEDALLAVQLASTIMGCVPEPFTMAIGKTMSLATSAAQETAKFSEMAFNAAKLREAWEITKRAIDNPRDRALGLAALRLNPTLGMHAIAWAAMEKQPPDPIARMFLNSNNVNEQTLAVSGSEKMVRKYLEALLYEDRKMVDPGKINTNWALESFTLCTKIGLSSLRVDNGMQHRSCELVTRKQSWQRLRKSTNTI